MEKIVINGGKKLNGVINIQSAKNAVLPLLACCLLSSEEILLTDCPRISDVLSMIDIIRNLGGEAYFIGDDIFVDCKNANSCSVDSELTSSIRSSVFILGSIVSRFKCATISYPGGCEIGLRPIDLHLSGLRSLGVVIEEDEGYIKCNGSQMHGGTISLDFPSVGATENIMMAGVLTDGVTTIINAAREPEILDLQNFINFLGGKVSGAGSSVVTIEGVSQLGGGIYRPASDRIVAGTYLVGCAMCGGDVTVSGINSSMLNSVVEKIKRAGCHVVESSNSIRIKSTGKIKSISKIETQPYPGFPTDMQAQILAMQTVSEGYSIIVENLFESRYKHVSELRKMKANIVVQDRVAMVKGVKKLCGANVAACDLRGGAALVLAGLVAEGKTEVSNIKHIDRGYINIEQAFASFGADIVRK